MTLPFPEPNKPKKQFQCFVCGMVQNTYEEFKSHIIEKHEEGREYLTCPLKHCMSPVRELSSHFKAKHPNIPLPKTIQHRVAVMYDISSTDKRKRKVSFKSGFFESKKNGKSMHYRSSWEETFYKCLEVKGDVFSYDVEPFKIPYFYKSQKKHYYPDLIVKFADGRIEICEIKPANQTGLEQNKAKWAACEHFCQLRGWKFTVYTEVLIEKLKKECLNG